jgi:type VI secretion system secreted protein VgrG
MPSPKSGTAGTPVTPAAPASAVDADDAVAGGIDDAQGAGATKQADQLSSVQVKPYKPDPAKKSWIEIKMVDEDNNPVPGAHYQVTLPDGTVADGTLDDKGFSRVDGIDPGTCQITFPELDQEAWDKA